MIDKLDALIEKNIDKVIAIRRDIHENPELGMEEFRTSAKVAEELEKLGIETQRNIGGTGVVGLVKGDTPGKTIILRADMDALPLDEHTDLEFKSKVPGKMHACGHDVHTSILLGTAMVMSELRDEIKGNIKFVFQPAEECNPTGGARYMIEDGVLENPKVDAALALHVWDLPLGQVALKSGPIMAQSDRIFINIKGKSSHGAQPHEGIDAIVAAAHVITALQTIVSRKIDPMDSAVVSIGKINGGNRYNVIADAVSMEGTVRLFDEKVASIIPDMIKDIVANVCNAFGCEHECQYINGYSLTINDNAMTEKVKNSFIKVLGKENIIIAQRPASGGEDFSEFAKRVPSVFYWLGIRSEINKDNCIIHNPNFLVDERAIPIGIKTMCAAALDYLNNDDK
ncbi:MAG: amidohydrolase [Clostridiales bacterium]|jgi:amidohydrolase|nr:amidohydrolase [Clostridiales bacterium]